MTPVDQANIINVLRQSQRLNLRDPTQLARAKKVLMMANQVKGMADLPPEVNAELIKFYDTVGARPEVAGTKFTVSGNKWETLIRGK
jgi:hypothetical protein